MGNTRTVIAGVECEAISDLTYRVPLGTARPAVRGRGKAPVFDRDAIHEAAIVSANTTGDDPTWSVGYRGWIPDIVWPSAEAAVRAVRDPNALRTLVEYRTAYQAAQAAEQAAREAREAADELLRKLSPSADDVLEHRAATTVAA